MEGMHAGWDEIIRLKEQLEGEGCFRGGRYHILPLHSMVPTLQYIILIRTARPDLKFNAMSIVPSSRLQELFPAMEVRC